MNMQPVSIKASYEAKSFEATYSKVTTQTTTTEGTKVQASKEDVYIKSSETKATAEVSSYTKPKKLSAEQLKQLSDERIASFNKMVENLLGKQVKQYNKSMFDGINVTPEVASKAASAIAPGGEWSSDAVSDRLIEMAKALSGGDASKLETLKNAVKKGFEQATQAWGAKLPSICDETYDKTMQKFDEWEKEAAGTSSTDTE